MSEDEKSDAEKYVVISMDLLCLMTRYKNFFDLKRIKNKDVFCHTIFF